MKILFHHEPSFAIRRWQSLAKCVGIACEIVEVGSVGLPGSVMREVTAQKKSAVALDVDSLKNCCSPEQLAELADHLGKCDTAVLLLASASDKPANRFLQALTNDAVRGIESVSRASRVTFPTDSGAFTKELASHFYAREPDEALSLNIVSGEQVEAIMLLDQAPAFVCARIGKASVFVWATSKIFDMLRPLAAEKEFELAADQYIPAMIFLRFAFGEQCWRNPSPGTGIVIDDPLLKKNYGLINFPKLLESARTHGYHITLAFIPWNHWRSRAKNVRMFLNYSNWFSLCAHGCDHTNREFNSTDYEDLLSRNFVARQRMERHHERTGLACEPLMVCPQEQYSLEAMRAFADSRQFIGLVCTACMPRNLTAPQICGADLLLSAQDSFFGLPVFKRHYSGDMSVFAMALFLGKPAILVEHHEFFRDGPGGAEKFVSELSKVNPGIQWTSLAETVTRTHLRRRLSDGRIEARFFSDEFKLEHEGEKPTEYRLLRRIPATTLVRRVTVDGLETPFAREDGLLTFETRADSPRTIRIRVEVASIKPTRVYSTGIKYQASVAFRRGLSELRDNVIARNGFAMRTSKLLARTLKQTGN